MAHFLNLPVGSLLSQQIEMIGPAAVSLDSLWRAAGSPESRSPRTWLEWATPLVSGLRDYLNSFPEEESAGAGLGRQLLWVWDEDDSEPWRSGDIMSHELLARVYAAYLDSTS